MLVRKILRDRASASNGRTTLKGADTALHARTTLVLYHRDGAMVAQLDKGRSLVVGRVAPADIEIPDPGLSRQHARFWWDDQGIWVEDLKSTNGTKKNGERVERAKIVPGDEIAVGPVRVSIHVLSAVEEELRGFDGHDRFVVALEDELTRARTFQRSLALLMVRSVNPKEDHVSRWAWRVRKLLRPVDRVGLYGPAALLVSIPEATAEQAHTIAAEITRGAPPLTCNTVTFPHDGGTVDELIAAVQVAGSAAREPSEAPAVVVKSPAMKQVLATVKRLAQSTIGVLLHGETGTGKEVIARAIHEGGPRRKRPLCTINCGAIPATLIESVLFGHEQGAFTGADKPARGIFEQADGGTVLLDEVGELSPSAQAVLLRVLETKRVTRVGGVKEIEVDVRVIAATHRDLEVMVETGKFRQDLLYRLNTMTLKLPALRDRPEEIRPFAERFLKEASRQAGTSVRSIDPAALAALEAYSWPGNVRELRNVIDRAVVLAEGKAIMLEDLTERVRGGARPAPAAPATGELAGDYRDNVRKFETELILQALHKHGGNQTEAARALNLPLRTLVHKIQTYGIKKKFDR